MNMRTPLKNVRHLGSAKEGADHFWRQRVTGLSNLILVSLFIGLVVTLAGKDYATVRATIGKPWIALFIIMLAVSVAYHMRLGMQVIIEDYVHAEGSKMLLLVLNTFFAILVGATCVFAVLKLSFGA